MHTIEEHIPYTMLTYVPKRAIHAMHVFDLVTKAFVMSPRFLLFCFYFLILREQEEITIFLFHFKEFISVMLKCGFRKFEVIQSCTHI